MIKENDLEMIIEEEDEINEEKKHGYEIDIDKTTELMKRKGYVLQIYGINKNGNPKRRILVKATPLEDIKEIERELYDKGFRDADYFFLLIYQNRKKLIGGEQWLQPKGGNNLSTQGQGYSIQPQDYMKIFSEAVTFTRDMIKPNLELMNSMIEEQKETIREMRKEMFKEKKEDDTDVLKTIGNIAGSLSGFSGLIKSFQSPNNPPPAPPQMAGYPPQPNNPPPAPQPNNPPASPDIRKYQPPPQPNNPLSPEKQEEYQPSKEQTQEEIDTEQFFERK